MLMMRENSDERKKELQKQCEEAERRKKQIRLWRDEEHGGFEQGYVISINTHVKQIIVGYQEDPATWIPVSLDLVIRIEIEPDK